MLVCGLKGFGELCSSRLWKTCCPVCNDPVSDSFPWAGSAPGELYGGETEDYQIDVACPVRTERSS
jgi:hypothetical protein